MCKQLTIDFVFDDDDSIYSPDWSVVSDLINKNQISPWCCFHSPCDHYLSLVKRNVMSPYCQRFCIFGKNYEKVDFIDFGTLKVLR